MVQASSTYDGQLSEEIKKQYSLNKKVTVDGYIYVEVRKDIYDLPQAGL